MVQETVLIVQNTLDEVASVAERIKKWVAFTVTYRLFHNTHS